MLKIVARSLTWPDDAAASKAVEAAQRLLPRLQGEHEALIYSPSRPVPCMNPRIPRAQ